ncbi:MAG: peptidoglycan DD-metalloendopeptidase family protein [Gammaproteobacteria bacterium]|nr:peptidoglycan DD-metalloendopeptidase family protein [Gammaproteobacteria bacterium]
MTIAIALGLTLVVALAMEYGAGYRVPGLAVVALYLLFYFLVNRWRRRHDRNEDREGDAPAVDPRKLPTSGPVGRLGQPGLIAVWTLSNLLSLLNPFQATQIVRQLIGNLGLQSRERRSGDDGRGYRTRIDYSLPFRGEWLLYNGGTTPKTSHSWDVLGQRYALDFVQTDADYRRHTGRGTRPEEYYCYGEEILAAADGRVVAVEDRVRTAPLLGWGVCDFLARNFVGNHVLIEHAQGEYGLYAHLVPGSIAVAPGDRVARGQPVGRCGHTGHSSEPHLHFHLQDSADLFNGMGLPVRFTGLSVDGEEADGVYLTAGQRVRPTE